MTDDPRFERPLYTVPMAAHLVGMAPSTLATWARGYERRPAGRRRVKQGPVITSVEAEHSGGPTIPFVGLVEAMVVQAFRRTALPLQRIRRALELLSDEGELEHALASRRLFSDGARVLYDYAREADDGQLRLLTVVETGQRVFHEVIKEYLDRITFGDEWATEVIVPVTEHELLRIRPEVASGEPLFIHGGAPLTAVTSRHRAGEPIASIARDFGVPVADIEEALGAIRASTQAA